MPNYEVMLLVRNAIRQPEAVSLFTNLFNGVRQSGGLVNDFKHFGLELLPYKLSAKGANHISARRFVFNIQASPSNLSILERSLKSDPFVLRYLTTKQTDVWKVQNKVRLCKNTLSGSAVQDLVPVSTLPVPSLQLDLRKGGPGKNNVLMEQNFTEISVLPKQDAVPFYSDNLGDLQVIASEIVSRTGLDIAKDLKVRVGADNNKTLFVFSQKTAEAQSTSSEFLPTTSAAALSQLSQAEARRKRMAEGAEAALDTQELETLDTFVEMESDPSQYAQNALESKDIVHFSDKKQQFFFTSKFHEFLKMGTQLSAPKMTAQTYVDKVFGGKVDVLDALIASSPSSSKPGSQADSGSGSDAPADSSAAPSIEAVSVAWEDVQILLQSVRSLYTEPQFARLSANLKQARKLYPFYQQRASKKAGEQQKEK